MSSVIILRDAKIHLHALLNTLKICYNERMTSTPAPSSADQHELSTHIESLEELLAREHTPDELEAKVAALETALT